MTEDTPGPQGEQNAREGRRRRSRAAFDGGLLMTFKRLYAKMEPFPDLPSTRRRAPGLASLIELPVQNRHQQD